MRTVSLVLSSALLLSLGLPEATQAQAPPAAATSTATVTGTVQSEKGNLLVGATVMALHLPSGIQRRATTDLMGMFKVEMLLTGGPYVLQVSQEGYRSQALNNVFLRADQPTDLAFSLASDVVAVGTRRADRRAADAVAPVDVIDMRELALTAPRTDIGQLLNYVVPSFNSTRQNVVDIADHVDPSSLRGLGVDQMLVLVNGKRFHNMAGLYLLGTRGVGSSGTDVNTFSANALDRVEVLRDGAAAQYGSDAIAGVMNFSLKEDRSGGNVLVNTGIHQAGDGLNTTVSLNKGLKLGPQGFLNLTGEVDYRNYTSRNATRDPESHPITAADPKANDKEFEQISGDARSTNYRALYNAGVQLSKATRLYSFGSYMHRAGQSRQPWIIPSFDPAAPAVIVPGLTSPLGYQPIQRNAIDDASVAVGLSSGLGEWTLDLSNVLGYNRMQIDVSETVNPSLGANSPTEFKVGTVSFLQNLSNVTVSRLFKNALAGTNVAFGAEVRHDALDKQKGDEAGYVRGSRTKAEANAGSQGFLAFDESKKTTRQNYGAFLDVEADIVKGWTLGGAVRYEKYSDFADGNLSYKAATRVRLGKVLALRGGYSTGFRAPSIQQRTYSQTTVYYTPNGTLNARLIANDTKVREDVGLAELKPETSTSITAGFVLTPAPGLTLSADYYSIDVDNRILLSGLFGPTGFGAGTGYAGYLASTNSDLGQFFTNAVDTHNQGIDLVARYTHAVGRGQLTVNLAANFNKAEVRPEVPDKFQGIQNDTDFRANYIDQRPLSMLETGNPASKIFASASYEIGKFAFQPRLTHFGRVEYYDYNFALLEEGGYFLSFSPKLVTDLIVTVRPSKSFAFTLGGNNLFNVLPDNKKKAAENGHIPYEAWKAGKSAAQFENEFRANNGGALFMPYDFDTIPYEAVQMGFNGAFFYLKAAYTLGL